MGFIPYPTNTNLEVQQVGVVVGTRPILNFIGAVAVADDGANNRVNVTIVGGSGAIFTYDCPAIVAVGDTVYLSAIDTVDQADASSIATMPIIGIVLAKPTAITATVMVGAFEVGGFVGLTPMALYFGDIIAGGITLTSPSIVGQVSQVVGQARNATTLLMQLGEFTVL